MARLMEEERVKQLQEETQRRRGDTQFTYSANADSAQPVQLNTIHYLKKTRHQQCDWELGCVGFLSSSLLFTVFRSFSRHRIICCRSVSKVDARKNLIMNGEEQCNHPNLPKICFQVEVGGGKRSACGGI